VIAEKHRKDGEEIEKSRGRAKKEKKSGEKRENHANSPDP
jgi:hypothetical protein